MICKNKRMLKNLKISEHRRFISEHRRINIYYLDSCFSKINNEKHCLSLYKSFEIDKVAKSLMSSDVIPNIVPVVSVRDGSCLYNAISMILTGCQLKYKLRLKTEKELKAIGMECL